MTRARQALLTAVCLFGASGAAAQLPSDWELQQAERSWREGEYTLPAYPRSADLVEVQLASPTSFSFFIDAATLSVDKDGVVRFAQVARSPSGAENVSVEGIRCKSGTTRTYAFGRSDGRWAPTSLQWHAIERTAMQGALLTLWSRYFCPFGIPIRDREEAVAALRAGGHPSAPSNDQFGR